MEDVTLSSKKVYYNKYIFTVHNGSGYVFFTFPLDTSNINSLDISNFKNKIINQDRAELDIKNGFIKYKHGKVTFRQSDLYVKIKDTTGEDNIKNLLVSFLDYKYRNYDSDSD